LGLLNSFVSAGNHAKLIPIIPPGTGHGSDIYSELGTDKVIVYARFDDSTRDFPIDTTFSQVGIVKNPTKVGTDLIGRYYNEAYGAKTLITRMFTHTGPRRGDVFAESSFAKQIALIEKKLIKPVIEVGNLNSLRTTR